MKRLIAMRHAKSSWDRVDVDDFHRPLNERGVRDAPEAALRLKQFLDHSPQVWSASPARRVVETLKPLTALFQKAEHEIDWQPDAYLASPEVWKTIIQKWPPDCDSGLIVGHNPGMTHLIRRFGRVDLDNLPTSGIAVLDFSVADWRAVDWGLGELVWFDSPKRHWRRQ